MGLKAALKALFVTEPETVDPQQVALDMTLAELKDVSAELRSTAELLKVVVNDVTEENSVGR